MSVHLLGGGALEPSDAPLYAPFLAEAAERARAAGRAVPRVAIVSIHPGGQNEPRCCTACSRRLTRSTCT